MSVAHFVIERLWVNDHALVSVSTVDTGRVVHALLFTHPWCVTHSTRGSESLK